VIAFGLNPVQPLNGFLFHRGLLGAGPWRSVNGPTFGAVGFVFELSRNRGRRELNVHTQYRRRTWRSNNSAVGRQRKYERVGHGRAFSPFPECVMCILLADLHRRVFDFPKPLSTLPLTLAPRCYAGRLRSRRLRCMLLGSPPWD
jgi:hypothetical protein